MVGAGLSLGILGTVLAGVVLVTRWVPPWNRGHVASPLLFGVGILMASLGNVLMGLEYFGVLPEVSWEVRFFGFNGMTWAGVLVIGVSQILPVLHLILAQLRNGGPHGRPPHGMP
ncbi:hypothetical protein [Streptomyces sp. NPDC008122]|uniref:hypothetical protein n=1 Tax=Streptomyces sp. NPDC008122 TaxID=3364810 RepID=UPI0036EEBD27